MKSLDLPTLHYRRARGDIIEAYKYLHGIYKVNTCPLKLDERAISTRGHNLKLQRQSYKKTLRQKFLVNRVVHAWNSLPEEVVTAPSLTELKSRLDRHWHEHKFSLENFSSSIYVT